MSLYLSAGQRSHLAADPDLAGTAGKLELASFSAARRLALALMGDADAEASASQPVAAGELNALSVLEEILQQLVRRHLRYRDATLLDRMLAILRAQLGLSLLDRLLLEFAEQFLGAQQVGLSLLVDQAPGGEPQGLTRQQILLEVIVFSLLHTNPAAASWIFRLHGCPLVEVPAFHELVGLVHQSLAREPCPESDDLDLLGFLTAPARQYPRSLARQLGLWLERWQAYLGVEPGRIQAALDLLAEESAPRFPPGPGPSEIPIWVDGEEVRYSSDRTWMAQLVLIAKHTLVWLDQLAKAYGQSISRLDQIPDQELERLSRLGFTGLWLIGVWERSPASSEIKRRCGNPEAAASAYSLKAYRVAEELGGEAAMEDLQRRASKFGIRLGVDMVPNHMGLDADWVLEHPDWFIGQEECPFPAYRFSGPDLSPRDDTGIFLEDHYYDRSDAAVVFKRLDRASGRARYIYHGNDGTSTPWNDTAQLDYLQPQVRAAVADTILTVARRFPIVRFDAAMTLTREHFQRLWYPAPGSAGAIPSRSEHGMSRRELAARMPREFWREVVDRVAAESPGSLLLAEAFWLLEGYFVRTLGMHRVYNSAFMNMLRDGRTGDFRALLKETLAFDPEILKRFVNFLNNPDERTAADQFGTDDRYFGCCALMATLPGLPMFGHGQVEGLAEKYGMEYRRGYWDESPKLEMIARHEAEIAPLLQRRELFAEGENFRLFDLITHDGRVDERVVAFVSGSAAERVLVAFNNSANPAHGRLLESAPFRTAARPREDLSTETVAQALKLPVADRGFVFCRDLLRQREFLFAADELRRHGLEVDLRAFECRVMADFQRLELEDDLGQRLVERSGSRGVPSLARSQSELRIDTLRGIVRSTLTVEPLGALLALAQDRSSLGSDDNLLESLEEKLQQLMGALGDWIGSDIDESSVAARQYLLAIITLPQLAVRLADATTERQRQAGEALQQALERFPEMLAGLWCCAILKVVERVATGDTAAAGPLFELEGVTLAGLVAAGARPEIAGRLVSLLAVGVRLGWGQSAKQPPSAGDLVDELLADQEVRQALGVRQLEGQTHFSDAALELLSDWRLVVESVAWSAETSASDNLAARVSDWWQSLEGLQQIATTISPRGEPPSDGDAIDLAADEKPPGQPPDDSLSD